MAFAQRSATPTPVRVVFAGFAVVIRVDDSDVRLPVRLHRVDGNVTLHPPLKGSGGALKRGSVTKVWRPAPKGPGGAGPPRLRRRAEL
jgi:hypothetical protein